MKPKTVESLMVLVIALVVFSPTTSWAQYFSIQSFSGRYLQAHKDNGETHASNDKRGDEETWIIVWADSSKTTVAIQNASNGRYLSMREADCIPASATQVGAWEKWRIEDAGNGWVHIHSARTDYDRYLAANAPGDDTTCGGEVASQIKAGSTNWQIKSHSTTADGGGGGPDIVGILNTASQVLQAVVAIAGAAG
jgi:hypothetical protein